MPRSGSLPPAARSLLHWTVIMLLLNLLDSGSFSALRTFGSIVPGILIAFVVIWLTIDYIIVLRLRRRLPPGPLPLPLIGNFLTMRGDRPWIHWEKLSIEYDNPLLTLWCGNRPVIVCNDAWTISDLFDKRAIIYSSRPHVVMMGDMIDSTESNQVALKYNDQWRMHRKLPVRNPPY
jgi:CDP-diglyceride synthetase